MRYFIFFVLLIFFVPAQAQLPCGTLDPAGPIEFTAKQVYKEMDRLKTVNKLNPRVFMMNMYIIRNDSGNLGIDDQQVLDALDELNAAYTFANIKFEICDELRYIDDNKYLETRNSEVPGLLSKYNIDNVINVYFIPQILNSNNESICGSASFPSTDKNDRRVFMKNSCVDNGSTFIHELGHFFNLRHTHSTSAGAESVLRIDCETKGDGFCDTPADPRLNGSNVENCDYTGTEKDAMGIQYDADPTNFMSYAPKVCRISFSPEQEAAVSLSASLGNAYLRSSCGVGDYSIRKAGDELKLGLLEDLDVSVEVKNVTLIDNEEVLLTYALSNSNTGSEVLIHEEFVNFNENNEKITKSITIPFSGDLLKYKYLNAWVDIGNEIDEFSETNNKISFEIDRTISTNEQFKVFPNPVESELNFFMNSQMLGPVDVELFNSSGQMMYSKTVEKDRVFLLEEIDLSNLIPNNYILRISMENEIIETFTILKN